MKTMFAAGHVTPTAPDAAEAFAMGLELCALPKVETCTRFHEGPLTVLSGGVVKCMACGKVVAR